MNYVLYVITALYAILSIFASIVQMKNTKEKGTSFIMLGGGIILIITVILHIFFVPFNWLGAVIGGLLICAAAFINGKRTDFHIAHHIIRFIVTVLLTVGFILF